MSLEGDQQSGSRPMSLEGDQPSGSRPMSLEGDQPSSSRRTRKRHRSEGDRNLSERLRIVNRNFPVSVTGNILYSATHEKTYMHLTINGDVRGDFSFRVDSLQLEPPVLHCDPPRYRNGFTTFTLTGTMLPPGTFRQWPLPENFAAMVIVEAAALVHSTCVPEFMFITREARTYSGDSGDEAELDMEVVSPFVIDETGRIQTTLKNFWEYFAIAQGRSFQNAVGKYFLSLFFTLCTMAVPNTTVKVYMNTNPKGVNHNRVH